MGLRDAILARERERERERKREKVVSVLVP